MKIGIIIGRIGDIDGVALETEKWIEVLRRMGHEVFLIAGHFKEDILDPAHQRHLPCLSFFSPECEWEQNRAFFFPSDEPDRLLEHLDRAANHVATELFRWVLDTRLELVISENASALPAHLSMGMGIERFARNIDIPIITHDHDFAWERGDRYTSPFAEITQIVETTFPLRAENVHHAVINSAAQQELRGRFSIEATIVPNVMDFSTPYANLDEYNSDLPAAIGLEASCIPIFQITRIVRRKGIEVAIELVSRLEDPRIKLVITGSAADDHRKGYYRELLDKIDDTGMHKQVIFAHHKLLSRRDTSYSGERIYSLEDAYAHAVACSYFSTYEGFGNAFVEAVLAKKPIFVNNYQPVYWPDIGSKGFKTIMLEDNQLTDAAVQGVADILSRPALQREIAEHNFALGKASFSYEVLENKLQGMLNAHPV